MKPPMLTFLKRVIKNNIMKDKLTSKVAKDLADKFNEKQYKILLEEIDVQSRLGSYSLYTFLNLHEWQIDKLKSLGFRVTRESMRTRIEW